MFGVTEAADQGQDVQAELVVGQSDEGFGFRPIGAVVARAIRVGATAKRKASRETALSVVMVRCLDSVAQRR